MFRIIVCIGFHIEGHTHNLMHTCMYTERERERTVMQVFLNELHIFDGLNIWYRANAVRSALVVSSVSVQNVSDLTAVFFPPHAHTPLCLIKLTTWLLTET